MILPTFRDIADLVALKTHPYKLHHLAYQHRDRSRQQRSQSVLLGLTGDGQMALLLLHERVKDGWPGMLLS